MSDTAGPVRYIEPRGQAEVVLWLAALLIAVAAHLAALTWAREQMPEPTPDQAPVETEVTVEMIEMATQAAQPSVAEAEAVEAAAPPAPLEPAASVAAADRAEPASTPDKPAPAERVETAPNPPATEPVSEGATRITGAPVAAQSGAAPAERAEAAQTARAEEVREAREATPARITAAPVVAEEASRAEVASAERPPEEVPETATARVADDRIRAGQDEGRERLRSEAEVEAQEAVRDTGEAQAAAAPEPAPEPSADPSAQPPADTLAAAAPTAPAATPTAPDTIAARPAIPDDMVPERVTPVSPVAGAGMPAIPSNPTPAEPAPAPAPKPERDSDLPGPATEGGAAAPAPESDISEADRTRYTAILDYLKTYDGGACFAALPALGEETAQLTLDAFGPSSASLDGFRAGMEAETGEIPNTFLKPVSEAQCATLTFIREAKAYPAFNLYFDMENRVIASGDYLEGRILNVSGQVVHFLLIDDEGTVQALDSFLQFTRGGASFSIPMNLTAGPVVTQQLLLAVGTPARLDVVKDENGTEAASFFAALAAELEARGISADLSMVAFSVE
ncbi:hypothetical protein FHY55_07930 [Oceanicola sp. D3]|uniref:hypothetical protein n=1 Tax=Oceanicola sp. D3 TaxID=2587163 RepID=UPI00111FCB61|nr:hypothetical protein [Oceanicola sp. D3]QDC09173.1 hypothetical protein FHY55_07930 [Oceanicola sp. D3]